MCCTVCNIWLLLGALLEVGARFLHGFLNYLVFHDDNVCEYNNALFSYEKTRHYGWPGRMRPGTSFGAVAVLSPIPSAEDYDSDEQD